jgi:general secretion pathway protein A
MLTNKVGPVYVYGPIGSGKTSIARRIHQEFSDNPRYSVVLMSTPDLKSANAFLRTVMAEFDVKTERAYDRSLNNFSKFLASENTQGRTPVLLIDEAQHLRRPVLELIKFLLNYETDTQKLLQIILFGQNELATKIDEFPELKSRMFPAALAALNVEDAGEMIAWRFRTAGGEDLPFTPRAIQEVFRYSLGVPRDVCKLCDMALLAAYSRGLKEIGPTMVHDVAADMHLAPAKHEEVQHG